MPSFRYRPNVGAIIRRPDGKILIGERSDVAGAWQFPQGGIKSLRQLWKRSFENYKKNFLSSLHITESSNPKARTVTFSDPDEPKRGLNGQEQTYFLVELTAPDSNIEVGDRTT